jgi:radical SAM superfamily enzyme YgiQ (UPF0313 family)
MNPETLEEDLCPPKTWVPLGISYLASSLKVAGLEVIARDLHDWRWEEAGRLIKNSAPDIVGISCFTFNRFNSFRLASWIKSIDSEIKVIIGGPHATFFPVQILTNYSDIIDVVALGQGEETLVRIVRSFQEKRGLENIPGVAFVRNGQVHVNSSPCNSLCLDDIPFPDYKSFDLMEYKSPEIPPQYQEHPGTHIITSRGCPFNCLFCSVGKFFGGKWNSRSADNVLDELEMLASERGVQHVYFSDDLFTLSHSRTVEICRKMIDRGLEMAWVAETRVDCVNEEMLSWMRKAGCYRIYYGLESGSPRILKYIRKGFTVAQAEKAFRMTHQAGIEPSCFLMVGNPGESPETIGETVDLIWAIKPATMPILGITTILPGSELYESAKKQELIDDNFWLSENPPPLYTGEHSEDELIALQMLLTKGINPDMYEQLCEMGFDENYFRLREIGS